MCDANEVCRVERLRTADCVRVSDDGACDVI
jgi:hypothetical protein